MGRIEDLKEKFPVGSKVKVANLNPRLLTKDWPGIHPNMHQFFCGEELEVVGHTEDRLGSRLGLRLNTSVRGSHHDFVFNADWVSPALANPVPVTKAPVYRRRLGLDKPLDDVAADVNEKLRHKKAIRDIRTRIEQEIAGPEAGSQAEENSDQDIFDEDTVEIPVPDAEPEPEQQSFEPSWGTVIGGAFATAFGMAWKEQMSKAKQKQATAEQKQVEAPAEAVVANK